MATKGQFGDTDANAMKIMEAYGISLQDLQEDVKSFANLGANPSIFDAANNIDDKFKWDRRANLNYYDNFDAP